MDESWTLHVHITVVLRTQSVQFLRWSWSYSVHNFHYKGDQICCPLMTICVFKLAYKIHGRSLKRHYQNRSESPFICINRSVFSVIPPPGISGVTRSEIFFPPPTSLWVDVVMFSISTQHQCLNCRLKG